MFYDGWSNTPDFEDIRFPCKEMTGVNDDDYAEHKNVSLRHLAEAIVKKAREVPMHAINPKKKGETMELKTEDERINALINSLGTLAVESVSVKDLVYTTRSKQGNMRTKDPAWHSINAKGSHLPEAMRSRHVKATNFQTHYKKCTSIYGKLKNAKKDEKARLSTTALRIKNTLKQMVSSQAQKCIIDNLFTGSGFANKDGMVELLMSSLYWVKSRRNTNYLLCV